MRFGTGIDRGFGKIESPNVLARYKEGAGQTPSGPVSNPMTMMDTRMNKGLASHDILQPHGGQSPGGAPNFGGDRDIAIRTMLGEALGQGAEGMGAVMHTMLNRTRDPRWGGSVSDVALQPKQFSAWNEGAGGNTLTDKYGPGSSEYEEAGRVYDMVMSGQMPDPTGGATHYYSPAGMQALVDQGAQTNLEPRWLGEESRRGAPRRIGGHIFAGRAQNPMSAYGGK